MATPTPRFPTSAHETSSSHPIIRTMLLWLGALCMVGGAVILRPDVGMLGMVLALKAWPDDEKVQRLGRNPQACPECSKGDLELMRPLTSNSNTAAEEETTTTEQVDMLFVRCLSCHYQARIDEYQKDPRRRKEANNISSDSTDESHQDASSILHQQDPLAPSTTDLEMVPLVGSQ